MRISDWSSDVCSSDLRFEFAEQVHQQRAISRDILDILEHRPAAVAFDGADRLADRQAVRRDVLGPDADRNIARIIRSEERRVGKECVRTCRSRWSTYH